MNPGVVAAAYAMPCNDATMYKVQGLATPIVLHYVLEIPKAFLFQGIIRRNGDDVDG
jgi:hypothetical protein